MAQVYSQKTEMEQTVYDVISKIGEKISSILSSIWGWVAGIFSTMATFFIPIQLMLIITTVLVIIDLSLGMWINRRNILSSKLRDTVLKFALYIIAIGGVYSIEFAVGVDFLYKIVFVLAGLVEIYSISANFLVLDPNMPFLRLFNKLLEKEISKKIELSEKKVKNILNTDSELNKTEQNENKQ